MNFHNLLANLKLKTMANAPKLLMIGGTASVVGGVIAACHATTKVDSVLSEHRETVEKIHMVAEDTSGKYDYSEKDAQKDLTITYIKTGLKLTALYLPSAALTGTGLACFWGSHGIMKGRNVALAAAYATVDKGFKAYRERVAQKYGTEAEEDLYFNTKTEKIEVGSIDKNGKEKKREITVKNATINESSSYAFIFDENCDLWDENNELNITALQLQSRYLNDLLRAKRFVTLNEVRKALKAKETKAGQFVGWIYHKENDVGDNYIDLGLYKSINSDAMDPTKPEFNTFVIDPNVDGYILDKAVEMGLLD